MLKVESKVPVSILFGTPFWMNLSTGKSSLDFIWRISALRFLAEVRKSEVAQSCLFTCFRTQ
jgi:hypothetical protein